MNTEKEKKHEGFRTTYRAYIQFIIDLGNISSVDNHIFISVSGSLG